MSDRWRSVLTVVGVALFTMLGNASRVWAQIPPSPPPPPPAPHLVPAGGVILVIGGLVGYGIYRLRKYK